MDLEATLLLAGQATIVVAAVLAIAVMVPSRRRRCPRCGYELAVGLRCSECGHEACSERHLHRRPRRGRRLVLAMLVAVAGVGLIMASSLTEGRWATRSPDILLILLMPDRLKQGDPVAIELFERATDSKLSAWEWKVLLDRVWDGPPKFIDISVLVRKAWPANEPVFALCKDASSEPGLWLLGVTPLEARIEPVTLDGEAVPYRADETPFGPRVDEHVMLGRAPDSGTELAIDLVVGLDDGDGASRELRRERIVVPCTFGGTIDDHIEVDRSESLTSLLLDELRFELNNRHLRIRAPHDQYVPRTLAAPIAIDLVRSGDVVHTFDCVRLVSGGVPIADLVVPLPEELRGPSRPFGTAEGNDDPWTLRIRGVPLFALLDASATRCWAGEREVELERGEGERDLSYWSPGGDG